MSNHLHAHVTTVSADCDGPTHRSWVESFNEAEIAESKQEENDFSDIHFMNRVFADRCGPYAVFQMTVKVDDAGFEYNEATEEGYRQGDVRWCRESCNEAEKSYRDVYAEMMGY